MENQNFEEKNIKYISLSEASTLSEISRDYLNVLIRRGKLKAIKIGKNWLTTKAWLEEYCAIKNNDNPVHEYISLFNAAKSVGVTSGYLNVAVRRGKLRAVKLGRNWFTTNEWLAEYQKAVGRTLEIIPKPKTEELLEIEKAEQAEFKDLKVKVAFEKELTERLKHVESQIESISSLRGPEVSTFKDFEVSKKAASFITSQEIKLPSRKLEPEEKSKILKAVEEQFKSADISEFQQVSKQLGISKSLKSWSHFKFSLASGLAVILLAVSLGLASGLISLPSLDISKFEGFNSLKYQASIFSDVFKNLPNDISQFSNWLASGLNKSLSLFKSKSPLELTVETLESGKSKLLKPEEAPYPINTLTEAEALDSFVEEKVSEIAGGGTGSAVSVSGSEFQLLDNRLSIVETNLKDQTDLINSELSLQKKTILGVIETMFGLAKLVPIHPISTIVVQGQPATLTTYSIAPQVNTGFDRLSANYLLLSNNAEINGSLTVKSGATLSSLSVSGNTGLTGNVAVGGTLDVAGDTNLSNLTIAGIMTLSGSGASLTNASTTNLTVSGNAWITNGIITNGTITNASTTYATLPTFWSTNGTITNASTTYLTVGSNFWGDTGLVSNAIKTPLVWNNGTLTASTTGANPIIFAASTTERMRITPDGFVGIGTTTPTQALTVQGNQFIYGGLGVGIATTTNGVIQTSGDVSVGGNFYVSGNSTVIGGSSANTLTVNSSINSHLIPDQSIMHDLGSTEKYWNNAFINTLTVNSISAASTTIGGTQSSTFTINSDNATIDNETETLIFFRGRIEPNALLTWNSATSSKRFEFNQTLYINNHSASTTNPTLTIQTIANQTANGLQVIDNNSNNIFSVNPVGSNTTMINASTTNLTVSGNLWSASNSTSTFNGTLLLANGSVSAPSLAFTNSNTTGLYRAGSDKISFVTAGVDRLTIDSSGNTGLGTTTPSDSLDVYKSQVGQTKLAVINPNGAGSASLNLGTSSTGETGLTFYNSSYVTTLLRNSLEIATANSSNILLRPGGNTGVGSMFGSSIAPQATIDIGTNDSYNNTIVEEAIIRHNTTGIAANGLGAGLAFWGQAAEGTNQQLGRIAGVVEQATTTASTFGSYLSFWTVGTGGIQEKMRLTSVGALALATTTIPSGYGANIATSTNIYGNLTVSGNSIFNNSSTTNATLTNFWGTNGTITNASTTYLTVGSSAFFPGSGVWNSSGSVGIGTSTPNAAALLDLTSTGKGLLPPRMTTAQKNSIASPASGLMLFDTNLTKLNVYNGTVWKNVGNPEIGGDVTGGTSGSVLYVDSSGFLAQDNANFSWDAVGHKLTATNASSTNSTLTNFWATNGTITNASSTYLTVSNALFAGATNVSTLTASGLISFSGTDHAGLKLNNLTTAQRDLLTPASGMTLFNTTVTKMQVYNGSTWKNVGNPEIGAEVTGGTAGSVLFVDSSSNLGQDNANFSWDAVGHKLTATNASSTNSTLTNFWATNGTIGTLTLTNALTVANGGTGASTLSGFVYGNGASAMTATTSPYFANSFIGNASTTYLSIATNGWLNGNPIASTLSGTAGYLPYYAASGALLTPTSTIFISTAGNVGIGTTSPTQQLELTGSIKLPDTTASGVGIIYKGTTPFIHNFVPSGSIGRNIFMGSAGNFTMAGIGDSWTASRNIAIGYDAFISNTTGGRDIAIGDQALRDNTTGENNIALGYVSLVHNTTGIDNVSLGTSALYANTEGHRNFAVGYSALNANTTASYNIGLGYLALWANTTGEGNIAMGREAGTTGTHANGNVSGSHNIWIGYQSGPGTTSQLDNSIGIGYQAYTTASNQVVLGNDSITQTLLNGNVGIGTTSPLTKLSIQGTAGANDVLNVASSTGASLLYVNAAGNVGIGTANPSQLLDIKGSAPVVYVHPSTGTQPAYFKAGNSGTDSYFGTESSTGNWTFTSLPNATIVGNPNNSPIQFMTDSSATGARMTILGSNGNVGIGTTAPGYKLDVAGIAQFQDYARASYFTATSTSFYSTFPNASTTYLTVNSGGTAWITNGTITNASTTYLTVGSSAFFPGSGIWNSSGYVGIGSTTPSAVLSVNVSNATGLTPALNITSATSSLFFVRSDGNVGVGTTSPGYKLDVAGIVNATSLYVNGSPYIGSQWTTSGSDIYYSTGNVGIGTSTGLFAKLTVAGGGSTSATAALSVINSASTSLLFVRNDGNVGIGTTSPAYTLDVAGSAAFGTGSEAMRIDTTGNVGIGTSTPTSVLTVSIAGSTADVAVTNGWLCVDNDGGCIGGTAGDIYYNTGHTGHSDVAENYDSQNQLEAGDIVQISNLKSQISNLLIEKATSTSQTIIGIVSTAPAMIMGDSPSTSSGQAILSSYPVALAGRVPVKVSLENGPIAVGDRIAASSIPGVGMRAGTSTATTVGMALEPFNEQLATGGLATSTNSTSGQWLVAKILVFVNLGQPQLAAKQGTGDLASMVTANSDINMNGFSLVNVKSISGLNGLWSIDQNGNIVAQSVQTQALTVGGGITSGVTIYDRATSAPKCIYIEGGVIKTSDGACGTTVNAGIVATISETIPVATSSVSEINTATTTPPIATSTPSISETIPVATSSVSEIDTATTTPEIIIPPTETATTTP